MNIGERKLSFHDLVAERVEGRIPFFGLIDIVIETKSQKLN